jgi:hypothetical protein
MDAIGDFIAGVEAGAVPGELFCEDAVLDATVPNWRFTTRGGAAIGAEFGRWYADPGHFEDVRRSRLADGELVEFTLTWQEDGVLHMCHQAHILHVRDGRIASDTAFCGGRWPASLIAEMAEAGQATGS